jgi:hypothetical protein
MSAVKQRKREWGGRDVYVGGGTIAKIPFQSIFRMTRFLQLSHTAESIDQLPIIPSNFDYFNVLIH